VRAENIELLDLHIRIDHYAIDPQAVTGYFARAWCKGATRYPGLLSNFLDPIRELESSDLIRGVLTVGIYLPAHAAVVLCGVHCASQSQCERKSSDGREIRGGGVGSGQVSLSEGLGRFFVEVVAVDLWDLHCPGGYAKLVLDH